jgi:hypothetical protein
LSDQGILVLKKRNTSLIGRKLLYALHPMISRAKGLLQSESMNPDAPSIIMLHDLSLAGCSRATMSKEHGSLKHFFGQKLLGNCLSLLARYSRAAKMAYLAPSSLPIIFLLDSVAAVLVGRVDSKLPLLRDRTLASLDVGLETNGGFRGLVILVILSTASIVAGANGGIWSLAAGLSDLATFVLKSVRADDAVELSRPAWRG